MPQAPECVRCGYDLSGEVARWAEACPLESTCPECGLTFAWRVVLNPVYRVQVRLFENARTRLVLSFWLTLWMLIRPWRFWRWVRLEHEVAWGRLLVFAIGGAGVFYGMAVGMACLQWASADMFYTPWTSTRYTWESLFWPYGMSDWDWFCGNGWALCPPGLLLHVGCWAMLLPMSFFLLPFSLRTARVRHEHLARFVAYTVPWAVLLVGLPLIVSSLNQLVFGSSQYPPGLLDFESVNTAGVLIMPLVGIWGVVWGWQFASGYCRLPRGLAIGVVLTIVSFLASVLALYLVGGLDDLILDTV